MLDMFRSATMKLTAWYMAIITFITVCFSVVIYHFAISELRASLHHQSSRIYDNFPVFNNSPLLKYAEDLANGSHHILLRLLYFNIVVVIFAGFASYFLARRTLEPIEAAHARQERFTADVSHELRTPLTSLKMTSEVALMDPAASKADLRTALESNIEDIGKMNLLINNLLRLSRLDDEQTAANFSVIPVHELVSSALSQVTTTASARKIDIKYISGKETVYGDQASLAQAIVILLDNAIKYSLENTTITITATTAGKHTTIKISDQGKGISKEALPHIFDRFYRADSSRNKNIADEAGFGLGLSIAKMIADRHNGQIMLTSTPGTGTVASLEILSIPPAKS
mgnify:CR=1 FL=1